jgi:hypothetical protein
MELGIEEFAWNLSMLRRLRFKSTKYFDIFTPVTYLYVTVPGNNRIVISRTLLAYAKSTFRNKNRPEKLVVAYVGKTSSILIWRVGSVPCRQPDRQPATGPNTQLQVYISPLPPPHTLYILKSISILSSHDHHTKK